MTLRICLFMLFVAVAYAAPPQAATRDYNPDVQNVYHLFTRASPSVSQPIVLGAANLLLGSNFDASKRTALIIHGWTGSATSNVNTVLIPAYLAAADMNVIVVDWNAGASLLVGGSSPENAIISGVSVARFIDWVIATTGTSINNFNVVGHSLGAHQAAVVGRNTNGRIPYITALDPGANMEDSGHIFGPDAAIYTESIHTNADIMGHGLPVAHSDFYPNGGDYMPGCGVNFLCNHNRSFYYFAESLFGGFTGQSCGSLAQARLGLCLGLSSLNMGGLNPKTGSSGIYHLTTNPDQPFNQG